MGQYTAGSGTVRIDAGDPRRACPPHRDDVRQFGRAGGGGWSG
jgi:hypothetical protein